MAEACGWTSPSAADQAGATLRATYAVGCDGSRSVRARSGRDHPDAVRPRPADGAAGVPLDRAARAAGALSRQILLQRAASGAGGLLAVLRPGRPRQHLVLPRAGAARHDARTTIDFAAMLHAAVGRRVRRRARARRLLGPALRGRRRLPARAACSSPATRRTAIRPMAATGSTPASRTRATWAGSSPPCCGGWGGPTLLDSYDAERRPVFASTARDFIARSIEADREFLAAFDPKRDQAAFERRWAARSTGAAGRGGRLRAELRGLADRLGRRGQRRAPLGTHRFAARPGHHLAPLTLSDGPERRSRHWGQASPCSRSTPPARPWTRFEAAAAAQERSTDRRARYKRRRAGERADGAAVLVRPDQFVAWTVEDELDDAAEVLRRSVGRIPR